MLKNICSFFGVVFGVVQEFSTKKEHSLCKTEFSKFNAYFTSDTFSKVLMARKLDESFQSKCQQYDALRDNKFDSQ